MKLFGILLLINLIILFMTRQPQELIDVKEKYQILRDHLKATENEKFKMLIHPIPITGLKRMNGTVGYNVNKGADITICLDGDSNKIFHVLIHELAHSTVTEFSHSKNFWKNFVELRGICESIGIYKMMPQRTKFCGQHIQDK